LEVTIKSINWEISELLEGNPYRERFSNGIFAHSFLSPAEYRRQHAPVGGVVLEAGGFLGQVYLELHRRRRRLGR
jgi:phosphatidylserine decarboxylase